MDRLQPRPTILYVEDEADDVFFLRRALQTADVSCHLQTVSSVLAAKSYLSGKPPYCDRERFPLPEVVLTDSSIAGPDGSGVDLISWIRSRPQFANVPILCTTGNDDPSVGDALLKLGVTCHLKTTRMVEIAEAVKAALARG